MSSRPWPLMLTTTLAALAAAPAADAGAAGCSWLRAPSAQQPPCPGGLADSPWAMAHGGPFAQDSSPLPGPTAADRPKARRVLLGGAALGAVFSPRYKDGRRVVWSLGGTLDYRGYVWKVDERTAQEIGRAAMDEPGAPPSPISGIYAFLSHRNELHLSRGREILIFGDERPGVRTSAPKLRHRFRIPDAAYCRPGDEAVGMVPLDRERVALLTKQGVISIFPMAARRLRAQDLVVGGINGAACADPAVPDAALERVSNSMAADAHGHLYPVSDRALYRFDVKGRTIRRAWRVEYGRGEAGGARLDAGSGSTPTLMGTRAADDRFVVIVDGSPVMNLVLAWRDRIPEGWQPIAPGKPRRIACEIPVTFGDPNATATSSEQSVVVRGHAAYIPNNTLRGTPPQGTDEYQRLLDAALAAQDPARAPLGAERIDWDPRQRRCVVRWANPTVSLPNGVPAFSSGSQLLYGIGVRNGVWGLEGLDARTGRSRLWVPSSAEPTENSLFSGASVGEGDAVWTGSLGGLTVYRPRR